MTFLNVGALTQDQIGQAWLDRMMMLGNQVSPAVGAQAVAAVRHMINSTFQGPVELKSVVLVMVIANALGEMIAEIDPTTPILVPESDGRVRAMEAAFCRLLRDTVADRSVHAHRSLSFAKGGGQ